MLRKRARRALWWWRGRTRPLPVEPRLPMDALIRALYVPGEIYTFDEVRRLRAVCRSRDRRPPEARRSGSTRIEDCHFLYLLVRKVRPRAIFEIGTLIGTSASTMAHAQTENGDGGVLYTVDASYAGFEPFDGHAIRCFPGQRSQAALEALRREQRTIDFLFVDGAIGREDLEIVNAVKSPHLVVAVHDYKPPLDKGIRNAWTIDRALDRADHGVWVLPARQGVGYPAGDGLFVNSAVAVRLPARLAEPLGAGDIVRAR